MYKVSFLIVDVRMAISIKTQASMVGTTTAFVTKCKNVITQYRYNIKNETGNKTSYTQMEKAKICIICKTERLSDMLLTTVILLAVLSCK